jgi:hypothetical protein
MERMVSMALELEKLNAGIVADYAREPIYGTGRMLNNLLIADALKGQFMKTGSRYFLDVYTDFSGELFKVVHQALANPSAGENKATLPIQPETGG